jgi:large subunit ribosomal protein L22
MMGKKGFQSRLSEKEASASIRAVHISSQKLNLVANLIRGLKAESAISELTSFETRFLENVNSDIADSAFKPRIKFATKLSF